MLRRSPRWLVVMLLVGAVAPVSMHSQSAGPTGSASSSAQTDARRDADSAASNARIRRAIEQFQDRWRSTWQGAQGKQKQSLNLTDIRGTLYSTRGNDDRPALKPAAPAVAPKLPPPPSPVVLGGDRQAMRMTPSLQRYLSILCIIGSPSDDEIERRKRALYIGSFISPTMQRAGFSLAMARLIEDPSGGTCPAWLPESKDSPLDEDEAIDLALPLSERRAVAQAREALIEQLDRAHAQRPHDEWLAGQRVRFLLDQRAPSRAGEAAAACASGSAWCVELSALVQAGTNDFLAAESMFREADALIARAPRVDSLSSCVDPDVVLLLPPAERRSFATRSCAEQAQHVSRLWWLSDPLWAVPGNERYVAHRLRQTQMTLRAVLDRDERYVWARKGGGRGMRELIIRYGWPSHTYWSGGQLEHDVSAFRDVGMLLVAPPYSAKEYRRDRQAVIPLWAIIDAPFAARESDWTMSPPAGKTYDEWWPDEHMRLATQLVPLPEGQEGYLRRDSSVRLVAAVDDAVASIAPEAETPWIAMLMGSTGPDDVRTLRESSFLGAQTLRFDLSIAPTPSLMLSTEVFLPSQPAIALRARRGVALPPTLRDMPRGTAALSAPMFLALPTDVAEVPTDADSAAAFLAGTLAFDRARPLAVYWESYGYAATDTLDVRLRVVRDAPAGLMRSLGEMIGVAAARRDSVLVQWREPDVRRGRLLDIGSDVPVLSRALALNVQQLPAGRYRLVLEMQRADGTPARSEQTFVLRE